MLLDEVTRNLYSSSKYSIVVKVMLHMFCTKTKDVSYFINFIIGYH